MDKMSGGNDRGGERQKEEVCGDRQSLRKQRQTERTKSSDTGPGEVSDENKVGHLLTLFFLFSTAP
jgi:hypothetical protein